MTPGIYSNMDIVAYHQDHSAVSKSGLVQFKRSPRAYRLFKNQAIEQKETDAMRLGSAVHTCVLEPDLVGDLIVKPPHSILGKNNARNTKKFYDWRDEQQRQNKIIVTDDQWESVMRMVESIFENPANMQARELLSFGPSEVTFVFDDVSRQRVKVRPDKLPGAPVVVNLKTCRDASEDAFGKQSANLHYHWSAFLDTLGTTVVTGTSHYEYYLIAVENVMPFDVAIYRVPPTIMDLARSQCEPLLADLAFCETENIWPGYGSDIKDLRFPGWAFK